MIVTGTTNLVYVTSKGVPESKVTSRFLTVLVGEIEFPRNWVGNFEGLSGLSITK